ncbi:MAG TPA: TetR/AcrR family transcriptional regulator [Acidimicrobiales bacterium]
MPAAIDAERRTGGRTLDSTRDADIRAAVLELLAEQGYDRLTIEAVAARARAGKATIYRRWPSKVELVLDAVNDLKPTDFELPDTGNLADDIRAYFEVAAVGGPPNAFPLIAGLAPALLHDQELAAAFREHFVGPRIAKLQFLLDRAVARGEVDTRRDADLLCAVFPAFMLHRTVFGSEVPDADYARRIVEEVLIPLATAPSPRSPHPKRGHR